jgi:methyl-accepting chemotaxis protein
MSDNNRRRVRIINEYQYRMILTMIFLIILISGILLGVLFLLIRHNIAVLPQPLPDATNLFQRLLYQPFLIVVIIAMIIFIVSFWVLIVITHRIYGPIYRLGKFIKALSKGEKTGELRFRKGDAVDHMADLYNELYESLKKTLHYNYNELITVFSDLEDILDQVYKHKIDDTHLFNNLQALCNRIAKALDLTMGDMRSR